MRKRWLFNLALVLLLAGLTAAAWYVERDPPGEPLLGLDPAGVDRFLIQSPNRDSLRLERRTDGWWMTAPESLPASDFHVRQVLNGLSRQSVASYPVEDMEPVHLGLDPPRVRLEVDGRVLLFGGTDAMDGLRYIQAGDRVHLVRDSVGPLLEGPWWNFIDRRPVPPDRTLVRVETPAYDLSRADGGWRLQGAPEDAVDAAQLGEDWQSAGALVVRQVRRRADVDAPVRLHFADGSVRGFAPASEAGERRLVDVERGLAYVFDPASMDYLMQGRLPQIEPESGPED